MLSGFINLYKSGEMSSNRALSILKKYLKENNISTKVGHLGTLDPIAEGVLPVALGRATRLFDYTLDKLKSYRATFKFGVETDTLDRTGEIIREGLGDFSEEEILGVIPKLIGKVMQVPPNYSAKSVDGRRAYKMARNGESFELAPKQVDIYDIRLVKKSENGEFIFDIDCGGGTYIRSIARDMAYLLGTVGIMIALLRTKSGEFLLENAVKAEDIININDVLLPMEYVLKYPKHALTQEEFIKLKNGLSPDCPLDDGLYTVYAPDGSIMGIGSVNNRKISLKTWLL